GDDRDRDGDHRPQLRLLGADPRPLHPRQPAHHAGERGGLLLPRQPLLSQGPVTSVGRRPDRPTPLPAAAATSTRAPGRVLVPGKSSQEVRCHGLSRSSPASGPTCPSPSWPRSPTTWATTGSSSPAGATTSTSGEPQRTRRTSRTA